MASNVQMDPMHDLTDVIGQRAHDARTTMIGRFEVNARVLLVSALSCIPAMLLAAVLWTVVGSMSIFVVMIMVPLCTFLFTYRTTRGTEQTLAKEFLRKRTALTGTWMLGLHQVEPPGESSWLHLAGATSPGPAYSRSPIQQEQFEATHRGVVGVFEADVDALLPTKRKKKRK